MSGSNGNGYVQLRRGIHDGKHRPKLPPTRFAAYIHLILDAETDSGIVHTSAGSLVSLYGFTERAARDALERLEKDGYIRRFHVRGRRGEYPALVNNYKVTTGAMRGAKLNAANSVSLGELAYDSRDDDVDDSVNDDVSENGDVGAMIVPLYKGSKKEKEKKKNNSSSSPPPGQNENFQLSTAPTNGHSKWPSPELLIEMYNEQSPDECPAVEKLTAGRIKKAKECLKQFSERGFWELAFKNLHQSDFLRGYKPSPGHENFKATFDWLLSKGKQDGVENVVKVWEGRYDG